MRGMLKDLWWDFFSENLSEVLGYLHLSVVVICDNFQAFASCIEIFNVFRCFVHWRLKEVLMSCPRSYIVSCRSQEVNTDLSDCKPSCLH